MSATRMVNDPLKATGVLGGLPAGVDRYLAVDLNC